MPNIGSERGVSLLEQKQKENNLRLLFYIQTLRDILIQKGITTHQEFQEIFSEKVNISDIDTEMKNQLLYEMTE